MAPVLTLDGRIVQRRDIDAGEWVGYGATYQATAPVTLAIVAAGYADYRSFDGMGHSMHGQDPRLFTDTVADWAAKILS